VRRSLMCGAALFAVPASAGAQTELAQATAASDQQASNPAAVSSSTTQATAAGDEGAIQDIVVTAQRRRENLQDVPITVTAISAPALAASAVTSTADLVNVVPGLTVPSSAGYALPHLRGVGITAIGPGIENSVATYVDGVYRGVSASNALALNNIAQVEVEKGPQGTLFGRNATGGLIQVTTKDPSPGFSGAANIGYGNYNTVIGDFYVTGGSDVVAGDLAAQVSHQGDGWGKNVYNGEDVNKVDLDLSLRSKWLIRPADGTKITAIFDYTQRRSSTPALTNYQNDRNSFYPAGYTSGLGPYDVNLDSQPLRRLYEGGASLQIDQDVGFANIVNTVAYRRSTYDYNIDFDLGHAAYSTNLASQSDKQFTEEFQILSKAGDPLTWVAGIYYYHASDGYDPQDILFSGPAVNPAKPVTHIHNETVERTDSVAAYAQATEALTSRDKLTLGLRYTYERRDLDGDQTAYLNGVVPIVLADLQTHVTTRKPTWRIAYDHKFSDGVQAYISYNRGLKSGGYNAAAPTSAPYQPEQLDAYEVGLKMQFLDRRVTLNSSVFYYDYNNIQVSRFVNGSPQVYNGGKAKLYGLDVDFSARVTDRLTLSGGLELMHSEFTSFPNADFFYSCATPYPTICSLSAQGNELPQAPDVSGSINLAYRAPLAGGEITFTVNEAVNGGYYFAPNNEDKQSAYSLTNGSIRWTHGNYSISIWGKNLFDKIYPLSVNQAPTAVAVSYAAPRTFGATVGVRF
jgi:iron complex outermembrane recepter protein